MKTNPSLRRSGLIRKLATALLAAVAPLALAQSPAPTTASGEDWSFPFTPAPSLYSGLFRMGPTSAPSGMVKHIGRTLSWASLNPSDGVFDFSYVDGVLAAAQAGNYSVIFRLKSSVVAGSEQGQGGTQSQMMPQWVVNKYNLTSGFTFNTTSSKTYGAPWNAGVQAEFYKLIQEIGRRRLLESPHVFAFYLHGCSSSDGEEMYIGDSTYTNQAAVTAVNAGYTGASHGSPLADAIMDCWETRMDHWAEIAGPYIYKVIWVGASGWSGVTYPKTLLNNYALTLGLGGRHGFIEHYYYGAVQTPVAGQNYGGAYVTSNWSHALRDGRYWGDENEETDEYKNPFNKTQDIPAGEARDLAYRSSFFRASQLGMNFLWTESTPIDRAGNNDGNSTNDALPTWFTLVAGKGPAESPDAAIWLRQADVRKLPAPPFTDQEVVQSDPPQAWKNLERMLMQRDISGATTQAARFINMPHVDQKKEDYNNPNVFGEYTARSTNVTAGTPQRSIAFQLEPAFRTSLGSTSVKIKVTYFDELGTVWNVKVAKGSNTPITLGTVTNGTSNAWRTATFTLTSGNAPIQPGGSGSPLGNGIDFVINVPSGSNNVTARYVRVVRTAEVAVAPTIKVHPISQQIPTGGTTLHVVPKGPPPYTYQWKKNGTNVSGATAISLARTTADAGNYTVVVSNAAGSVPSTTAILMVNTPPAITTQPASQTIMAGQNATFTVVATGSPAPTYQWRKNGSNLSGATNSSYTKTNAQFADQGNYSVVVTNVAGSVTSNNAVLTVNYIALLDSFDDGNVTSPLWEISTGTGGVTTITATATSGSEPASPDGSSHLAIIDFGSVATWKYTLIHDTNYGPSWSANGVNAIRLHLKGSIVNPSAIPNDKIKVQLREDGPSTTDLDDGERWSFNIGTAVQNNNSTWTTITASLSSFVVDGGTQKSGGTAGVLDLSMINQIRFFDNAINAQIKIRVDRIEAIKQ